MGRSDERSTERTDHYSKRERKERHHERREKRDRADRVRQERRRRSRSPEDRHRAEADINHKIKEERRDRGYEREDLRHRDGNDNEERVMNIKEERVMNIKEERECNDQRRLEHRRHQPENPFQATDNAKVSQDGDDAPQAKENPNFGTSGALAEDTNTYRGVVIKYNEPPEARKPKRKWRFYIFKGDKELPVLQIHRQSAYLLGRDRKVADIPVDHPSCSKQHAALQYRLANFTRDDGTTGRRVRPYIIDLDSANGTFLNNNKIEPRRYYELQEKDVLKFAFSSRDYVLLHANSKDDEEDD